ncbi:MAG: response regulator [Nitrospinae bacterium]|nr:response regulator [Nitrospinota bacterium]
MGEEKLRVLLVDDDKIDRMAIERLVREKGLPYDLVMAGSLAEAMERISERVFDVVMLDYMLGDGTGLDILRKVKDTPVLFVTGSGDEGVAVTAMKMGAYDYLIKDPERRYLAVLPETISKVVERRKAEDAVRKLSRVVEQAADSVMITDVNGAIEYVNPSFELLTGYSLGEVAGQNPRMLKSGVHDNLFYAGLWGSIMSGSAFRGEVYNKKKSGDIYCCESMITPIKDASGRITHFVATSRDITERKSAEMELRKAKEAAEEATKLKDKFVSLVSHDLRSPLSSVMSLLNLVRTSRGQTLDADTKNILETSTKSLEKMVNLIEELLNISRLKTGKLKPRPRFFDGSEMAGAIVAIYENAAKVKQIKVVNEVPAGTRLFADMTLFQEVLENLASNAVKFCSAGDTIKLFIPAGEPSTVAVSDTGEGIDPVTAKRIFNYEDKTSTIGTAGEVGTGLGLPLSRDIMLAHGGWLSVESEKGMGAVFHALLPDIKPRVMLVEDEGLVRQIMADMLTTSGLEVIQAADGEEALEKIKTARPHIVVTDLMMPRMDGFELIRLLKENPEYRDIPIITLTGAGQTHMDRALSLGADDFVTKPARRTEMIPRLQRLIGVF